MKRALATLLVVGCDAQVAADDAGPPIARLTGTAAGFGPEDVVDAAEVRWNPRRGAALQATCPQSCAQVPVFLRCAVAQCRECNAVVEHTRVQLRRARLDQRAGSGGGAVRCHAGSACTRASHAWRCA